MSLFYIVLQFSSYFLLQSLQKYAKICALIYKKNFRLCPGAALGGRLHTESLSLLFPPNCSDATADGEFTTLPRASLDFRGLFGGREGKSRIKNMALTTKKLRTRVYILLKIA